MSSDQLIVFLRAPRWGAVKTRLSASIGPDAALAVYRSLAETLLSQIADLQNVELCYTPDDGLMEIEPWRRPGWQLRPQGPGDLGVRMENAFAAAFAKGARRVALIGSDCPSVTSSDIGSAWAALERHDVILGPAEDGGYWLIALNQPQPRLFTNIRWSTNLALADTLAAAQKLPLRVCLLRRLRDVDTHEDLVQFWRSPS